MDDGSSVPMTATATAKPGASTALSYRWQQVSGPAVVLANDNALQTSFTAPSPGGAMVFRFTATDADGIAASGTVNVRANGLPVVAPVAPVTVTTGNPVSFRAAATDPENDTVTFSVTGLPSGATFNSTTGEFSWSSATPAGSYPIALTPNDGFENGAVATVTVTVNDPPRGGGGSMDLLGLGLLGLWGLARLRRRRSDDLEDRNG